ncbi:MAG: xanthan lyase [Planctomycetaceae bacterium]|nr:xanthan lyase [Planctomycetaceae bacterium]
MSLHLAKPLEMQSLPRCPRSFGEFAVLCCLLGCWGWSAGARGDDIDEAKGLEFFETKIRPVLVKHCYECHSAESKEVKGGLRVDSATGLKQGGDSGPVLVVGKPRASLLIEVLRYEGAEMPPVSKLSNEVISAFERWVSMGAPDPRVVDVAETARHAIDIEEGRKFWAFQPVQSTDVPKVEKVDWPRSQIDAFVLSSLEQQGLAPSRDADRVTLVRRLYYDLTGLPPSPEEVIAFVNDSSAGAVETLVDKLLDSPQFGVQWGRHWLDVARYADSNGGDFNATFHNAWRYRDYVVNAMNNDKPFDQFVREQIAGDLLPYETDEQRAEQMIATGILMIGTKMLSERDKEKLRMDVVDEQINTIGKAFMGMTLGCARCHDHKFDPIPTRDYYALAGIFRSTSTLEGESQQYVSTWPKRTLPADEEHVAAVKKYDVTKKELKTSLDAAQKDLAQAQKTFDDLGKLYNELTIDDTEAKLIGKWIPSTYSKGFIGKGYIHDDQTDKGQKSVEFPVKITKSGRYDVRLAYTPNSGRADNVPIVIRHANGTSEVSLNQQPTPPIDGQFASVGAFEFKADSIAIVRLSNRGTVGHVIADAVRLVEVDKTGAPIVVEGAPANAIVEQAKSMLEVAQTKADTLEKQLKELDESAPAPLPKAIAVIDHKQIGDCEVRVRGETRNLGPKVERGFLQVANRGEQPKLTGHYSGRQQLAEWIASPDHPLTARVIVNRVWCHLIGEGLVRSVDNFGNLGERPTHPELLDHLASEFVRDGWSIKRAIRRIALSRTYQMSSDHNETSWQADPSNKLLWRAYRRRVPAEAIRDSMLAISGQLDLEPDGSPVKGLGTLVTNNSSNADTYKGKETSKRSVYLPIIRNELPPILTVFDFADPDLVTGKRSSTNVPAQALLLMNSPFVMQAADLTAKKLANREITDDELIAELYQLVFARQPTKLETDRAVGFLRGAESLDRSVRLSQLVHVLFASTKFRTLM